MVFVQAIDGADDLLDGFLLAARHPGFLGQDLDGQLDSGQRILHLVGHAGGQLSREARCFHLEHLLLLLLSNSFWATESLSTMEAEARAKCPSSSRVPRFSSTLRFPCSTRDMVSMRRAIGFFDQPGEEKIDSPRT